MVVRLKPVRQGEIDGLCGVYAVLNACRLLAVTGDAHIPADVAWDQSRRLFQALCMSAETRELFPAIVCGGTREGGIEQLLDVASKWSLRHSRVELAFTKPKLPKASTNEFFDALRVAMSAPRDAHTAYILGVAAPRSHWTVVRRIRGDRLTLFDSSDFPSSRRNWARFGEFTFVRRQRQTRKRNVIDLASSYLLTTRYR